MTLVGGGVRIGTWAVKLYSEPQYYAVIELVYLLTFREQPLGQMGTTYNL